MPEAENLYPVLRNAPIVESIAYFKFTFPIEEDSILIFREHIKDSFPKNDVPEASEGNSNRHVFTSEDVKRFVRIGQDDFAYHKLAPYGDGNDFRSELRIIWESLREVIPTVQVSQIALRAINRIEPVDGEGNHDDYFKTYPVIGSGVPDELFSAFMRLGLIHPEYEDIRAVINWAAQPPIDPINKVAFILDIEATRFIESINEENTLWYSMELLRGFRNRIFFESITEKTKEMYQ